MFLLGSPLSGSVGVVSGERERGVEERVTLLHLFCFVGRRLRGSRQARTAAHLLVFPLGSRPLGWREAGAGKCLPSLAQRNPLLHRPSARDRDQGYEPFPAPGGYRLRGQGQERG